MTDFTKILDKAKELEAKMKESQEKIKNIKVEANINGSKNIYFWIILKIFFLKKIKIRIKIIIFKRLNKS